MRIKRNSCKMVRMLTLDFKDNNKVASVIIAWASVTRFYVLKEKADVKCE